MVNGPVDQGCAPWLVRAQPVNQLGIGRFKVLPGVFLTGIVLEGFAHERVGEAEQ